MKQLIALTSWVVLLLLCGSAFSQTTTNATTTGIAIDNNNNTLSTNSSTTVAGRDVRTRTLRFLNQCDQVIWVGAQGDPLPMNGGWVMEAGSVTSLEVTELIAGRFWPRTSCLLAADGMVHCATGGCGGRGTPECRGAGGQRPFTIAEITLGNGVTTSDFYDLRYSLYLPVLLVNCLLLFCC
jgi:hypothetical protein